MIGSVAVSLDAEEIPWQKVDRRKAGHHQADRKQQKEGMDRLFQDTNLSLGDVSSSSEPSVTYSTGADRVLMSLLPLKTRLPLKARSLSPASLGTTPSTPEAISSALHIRKVFHRVLYGTVPTQHTQTRNRSYHRQPHFPHET